MFRSPYHLPSRPLRGLFSPSSHVTFERHSAAPRLFHASLVISYAPTASLGSPHEHSEPSTAPQPPPGFVIPLRDGDTLVSPFEMVASFPDESQTPSTKTLAPQALPAWLKTFGVARSGKGDLSFLNVRDFEARQIPMPRSQDAEMSGVPHEGRLSGLALHYVQHIHPYLCSTDDGCEASTLEKLQEGFSEEKIGLLEAKGYRPEDVVCWGWVLSSETADDAMARMHGLISLTSRGDRSSSHVDVPLFLYLLILRSPYLSAISITMMIRILRLRLSTDSDASPERTKEALIDHSTAIILLVRLVRHARRVASHLMDPIAALATILLQPPGEGSSLKGSAHPGSPQILTHAYNRMLSLLAMRTSQHPFLSITDQQRAQFRLIREMTKFNPPLPVTREGYRALAQVQLAHKKTDNEREWARTKGLSWPPWKEDKLGISEDAEYPGSRSRASEILLRQVEAGYSNLDWEKRAQILSGWDTDGSPTIQTRTLLSKAPLVWIKSFLNQSSRTGAMKEKDEHSIWAARIRATRTVKEAWASFCAYDGAHGVAHGSSRRHQEPYLAMFEKLSNSMNQDDLDVCVTPGDGRETYAEPNSPRDFLYIPVEVPSMQAFYEKMRQDEIQPAGIFLSLLLDHAQTVEEGIKYIEDSKLSETRKDLLLNAHKYELHYIRTPMKGLQTHQLASFIAFLQRAPSQSKKLWYRPGSFSETNREYVPSWEPRHEGPQLISRESIPTRAYGLELLAASKCESLYVYNTVLLAITQKYHPKDDKWSLGKTRACIRRVLSIMKTRGVVSADLAMFAAIGMFLEKQLQAGVRTFRRTLRDTLKTNCENTIRDDLQLVKSLFAGAASEAEITIVSSTYSVPTKPKYKWLPCWPESKILSTPTPANLHLLIRILGQCGDHGGLVSLLRWMDRFAASLAATRAELASGHREMQRALVAVRVGLEFGWSLDNLQVSTATEAQIKEARELVGRNQDWGSWPSNAEVQQYVLRRRGPSQHQLTQRIMAE